MNTTTSYRVFQVACAIAELSGESVNEILEDVFPFAKDDADALDMLANDLAAWENRYNTLDADTVSNDWGTR